MTARTTPTLRLPFPLDSRIIGARNWGNYLGRCAECARQFMSDAAPCVTPSVPSGHNSTGRFCSERCLRFYYQDIGFQSAIDYMNSVLVLLSTTDERRAPLEASIAQHIGCEAERLAS
jgi:hypothetical protein